MIVDEDETIDQKVDDFLEHYGVKGMQWGVRNAPKGGVSKGTRSQRRASKFQSRRIDPIRRTAAGTGSKKDRRIAKATTRTLVDVVRGKGVQETSQRNLLKTSVLQDRIAKGEKRVTNLLIRSGGINIKDLKYDF